MMPVSLKVVLCRLMVVATVVTAFTPPSSPLAGVRNFGPTSLASPSTTTTTTTTTTLHLAQLSPDDAASVGVVGRGFVSVLTAKLSALAGYDTWMLYPDAELDTILSLLKSEGEELPAKLQLIAISDEAAVNDRLGNTGALLLAVDAPDNGVLDPAVMNFLVNAESAAALQRVVILSRNLNGQGMGFFQKAAKVSANNQIWAAEKDQVAIYQDFERTVRGIVQRAAPAADVVVVRAGTLKGGACGEEPTYYPQYLTKKFYEITKKDIITWNFLFDLGVRGVELTRGDVLSGPGAKAVFTATSSEVCDGDSSRCGVAEAMVRCLAIEGGGKGGEFGVKTAEGNEPPSDAEWKAMLDRVMS